MPFKNQDAGKVTPFSSMSRLHVHNPGCAASITAIPRYIEHIQVSCANPKEPSNARHKTVVNANARSAQTDGGAVRAVVCAKPVSMTLWIRKLFCLFLNCERNLPKQCIAADQSSSGYDNLVAPTLALL